MSHEPALPPPPPGLLAGASLFLDFDGTLVEIAPRPEAVVVAPRLTELLRRLTVRVQGRIAIISGRSVAQIDALIGDAALAVGGSHGVELRWPDGRFLRPERPPALVHAVAAMEALRVQFPGLVIEDKPFGAALHYRLAPEAEAASLALGARLAAETGLPVQPGKMMVELRVAGADKGGAVHAFMAEPDRAGTRPVFIGDDETDEHGFRAAVALGGTAILVGPPRKTAAQYRLPSVTETLEWLDRASVEAE